MSRNILVAVTGSIAAYKALELVRLLKQAGSQVRVIMTEGACAFVTPLSFQALSGHAVRTELFDSTAEAAMSHIELARWADDIVVAPATANTIAKLALGLADDLLTTVWLASEARRFIVPAMNSKMWQAPSTVAHMSTLAARGVAVLGPDVGEQACGEFGAGRMIAPEAIATSLLCRKEGVPHLVLITAGPTAEPIDPVRVISNRSSGQMGYALAEAFLKLGSEVILISGPTRLTPPLQAKTIFVESTREMFDAVLECMPQVDCFIAAAAVCDYRAKEVATKKIKKSEDELVLTFVKNPDILKSVTEAYPSCFAVGFALESHDLSAYAEAKRVDKHLDMIIANKVEAALGLSHASVLLLTEKKQMALGPMPKSLLAELIAAEIVQVFTTKKEMNYEEDYSA